MVCFVVRVIVLHGFCILNEENSLESPYILYCDFGRWWWRELDMYKKKIWPQNMVVIVLHGVCILNGKKTPVNTLELSCVALGNGGNGNSVCLRMWTHNDHLNPTTTRRIRRHNKGPLFAFCWWVAEGPALVRPLEVASLIEPVLGSVFFFFPF